MALSKLIDTAYIFGAHIYYQYSIEKNKKPLIYNIKEKPFFEFQRSYQALTLQVSSIDFISNVGTFK